MSEQGATVGFIEYKAGYKYQLYSDYLHHGNIKPGDDLVTDFIVLRTDGTLFIGKGYAWDGPSGPTMDTQDAMRGSLHHDAYYQLMRMGLLDHEFRQAADDDLEETMIDDGMFKWRATLWHKAVRWFANRSSTKAGEREVLIAP